MHEKTLAATTFVVGGATAVGPAGMGAAGGGTVAPAARRLRLRQHRRVTELSLEVDAFGTTTQLGAAAAAFAAAATAHVTALTRAGASTWGGRPVVPAQPFVAGTLLGYVLTTTRDGADRRVQERPVTAEVLDEDLARLERGELDHLEVQLEWLTAADRVLLGAVSVDHLSTWLRPEYPSRLVLNLGDPVVARAGADQAAAFLADLAERTALATRADAAHVLPSLTSELLMPEELAGGFGDGAGLPLARTQLRGVGWATLVAPQFAKRLGGADAVAASAPCEVARIDDRGAVWLQVTRRITDLTDARLARLREFLAPVLPSRR